MSDPVLEIVDLSVAVGGLPYVDGVSFAVGRGEVFGLLGPNGAGKTTLLRTLYQGARPSAGQIRLNGRAHQLDDRADPLVQF